VAEDVVVKEQLTTDMIEAGGELTTRLLQDRDFDLYCSLWLYTSESNAWKLVVGTSIAEPIHAYRLIQGIIGEDWPAHLDMHLYSISVLRQDHSLVRAIRSLGHFEIQELPAGPRPAPTVRVPKKITLTRIQDVFIEDARIYFIR